MKVCNNYSLIHILFNKPYFITDSFINRCLWSLSPSTSKKKYYVAATAFFSLSPPTMVVPPKEKPRFVRRGCVPRNGDGGKVLKRNVVRVQDDSEGCGDILTCDPQIGND
jgi:hypothetical protein